VNRRLPDMFTSTLVGGRGAESLPSWAGLLERFYEPTGLSVPALQELQGTEVPQPYRSLLVHSSDMTPTLAGFYGQTLRLRVLSRARQNNSYKREVVLWLAEDEQPVEYGVIRICLDRLPPVARRLVLQEERPLGDILQEEAIPHLSWPQAFFRLKADAHAGAALGLQRPGFLYGRRNVLLDGSRHLLAEVIEVLAPAGKRNMATTRKKPKTRTTPANGRFTDKNLRSVKCLQLAGIRT
jgi:chorismate-pyruvate lyase